MNNLGLLKGALCIALLSGGVRSYGQTAITLEEIFRSAETRSVQLRPSLTAREEAQREIGVARNGRLPDVNVSLSLSYLGNGFTTERDLSDYRKAAIPHLGTGLSLDISQPVYTGGAVKSAIEIAELKSAAARYAADFHRNDIRFRLAGFYLDIYKYINLRQVAQSNIDAARKVLDQMQARYAQGTALQNDITRYELLVSDLELQLVRINNTLDILNSHLVSLAGLPEDTIVLPDTTILARSLAVDSEIRWQHQAEEHAPSLGLARQTVEIGRRREALVRSERLPKIGLLAGWTLDGPILVEVPPINRNLSYWFVGVGVNFNLASLYKTGKSMALSRVSTRKAMEELAAEQERISLAIRADYLRYLEACEELKTRRKSLELAERNYRTVLTRYSAEMALITDMLDAANARIDAGQQLVNARIDILYYYYKLLFTAGKI